MPQDFSHIPHLPRTPLRSSMLDLVSRTEAAQATGGLYLEESNLIAALQQIVDQGQDPAERLLNAYHPDMHDTLARIFAEYRD